ncbi:MAG TPA: hypothetical protein PLN05_16800 [Pyrinomonadaceae bacterium]|nr:hypothetical protein [Pyrinomonadaceae bacterium]HRK52081.1 hypothetical protein [Pyrinomonadaceae bacterium]
MNVVRLPKTFYKARYIIASLCFIYAIFVCGFAYGLSITEEMFAAETVIRPRISFSGGVTRDYSDLLLSFLAISVCFLVFLLLTQTSRKLLAEVLSLIAAFFTIYFLQAPLPLWPGYIPGQTLSDSKKYLQATVWSDFAFVCFILILIVLQGIAIWQASKSQVGKFIN